MIQIAVLGHGIVGSGVLEVIMKNKDSIGVKAGEGINVKYILDLKEFPGLPYSDRFIKDYNVILNDPEISIVVEVMGGIHPAYDFTKAALEKGKSVVTSNKEVVAEKGGELLAIAKKNNLNYLFEASVGGGIPIIRPMSQCLAANRLSKISGILNGTTNYILTQMIKNNKTFDNALTEAQEKGYAERNPSADIEGKDACRKICILSSLAFGKHIYPDFVHTEGITSIKLADVKIAEDAGAVVKLIGCVEKLKNEKLSVIVAPFVVDSENPLSNVEDVFNGILVEGDATGDVMFYGKGAGKLPTASAVVADVIDCVKHIHARKYLSWEETTRDQAPELVEDYRNYIFSFMVRVKAEDIKPVKKLCEEIFPQMRAINSHDFGDDTFAFFTNEMKQSDFDTLFEKVKNYKGVKESSTLRVL
ncbi:MAG: homoserine dehydrogenase [Bacillota bacterium]|nr:homoserine dehydrogenase [Bacillota bacterium]